MYVCMVLRNLMLIISLIWMKLSNFNQRLYPCRRIPWCASSGNRCNSASQVPGTRGKLWTRRQRSLICRPGDRLLGRSDLPIIFPGSGWVSVGLLHGPVSSDPCPVLRCCSHKRLLQSKGLTELLASWAETRKHNSACRLTQRDLIEAIWDPPPPACGKSQFLQ